MSNIAVIMTVYYGDKLEYVKQSLESLYNQTFRNFDIYLQVDGTISDELLTFLKKEKEKKNIYYLGLRKENKGLDYSLNELLEIVLKKDYEFIARMDADDICSPYRFAKQYLFMKKNKDIDVCGTFIEEFNEELNYRKIVKYPLRHDELFRFFQRRVPIAHVTAFFRKSFFEKAGLYETTTIKNEDTILWLKGFKSGCRFANIPFVGVYVRINKNFFERRSGLKKIISDFKDRSRVIKELNYPKTAYIWALGYAFMQLSPSSLKKYLYLRLR